MAPSSGVAQSGNLRAQEARGPKGMSDASWSRMKACKRDRCRWFSYDHSPKRGPVWCFMEVCRNKQNAVAYPKRRREGGG